MNSRVIVDPALTLEQVRALAAEVTTYTRIARTRKRPSAELLSLMQDNQLDKLTKATGLELTRTLSQYISAAKIVYVRSAVSLEASQQRAIQTWFTHITDATHPVLISFRTDPSLIAGVVIQTPTSTYDWSLLEAQDQGRSYLRQVVRAT